jgi:transposase
VADRLIEGAIETDAFPWYIAEQLAPTLRSGQVVVMDNLSAHKADRLRQAIEARHCQLLFLPPYSPDFTPIEQAFSKITAILRGLGARTKEALQGGAPRRRSKEALQGGAPRSRAPRH